MRGIAQNFANTYKYGYQGSEKDDEVSGGGNSYTTEFRQLDPRLGRWFSVDPVFQPWQSPYTSMDNDPICLNDVLGLDPDPQPDSKVLASKGYTATDKLGNEWKRTLSSKGHWSKWEMVKPAEQKEKQKTADTPKEEKPKLNENKLEAKEKTATKGDYNSDYGPVTPGYAESVMKKGGTANEGGLDEHKIIWDGDFMLPDGSKGSYLYKRPILRSEPIMEDDVDWKPGTPGGPSNISEEYYNEGRTSSGSGSFSFDVVDASKQNQVVNDVSTGLMGLETFYSGGTNIGNFSMTIIFKQEKTDAKAKLIMDVIKKAYKFDVVDLYDLKVTHKAFIPGNSFNASYTISYDKMVRRLVSSPLNFGSSGTLNLTQSQYGTRRVKTYDY